MMLHAVPPCFLQIVRTGRISRPSLGITIAPVPAAMGAFGAFGRQRQQQWGNNDWRRGAVDKVRAGGWSICVSVHPMGRTLDACACLPCARVLHELCFYIIHNADIVPRTLFTHCRLMVCWWLVCSRVALLTWQVCSLLAVTPSTGVCSWVISSQSWMGGV
jgi:hypothetical protein